ncbi:MAG: hydroxymyristoyl-ACP dehydratase [Ferruginibacter sp.]
MYSYILDKLPYKSSFRFVDSIALLDENGITGNYTLKKDAFFYEDHFPGNPVTPGVIITEIMAQIGLVALGLYIVLNDPEAVIAETKDDSWMPLLTSTEVSFFKSVLPGEMVTVISKKEYFRFNKLKCYIEMLDNSGDLIARGIFAGIIRKVNIKRDL